MTVKKTAWVKVDGPQLDPAKKYVVRVSSDSTDDEDPWEDDWVVIEFDKSRKRWETLCNCESTKVNFRLIYVTHYVELPE